LVVVSDSVDIDGVGSAGPSLDAIATGFIYTFFPNIESMTFTQLNEGIEKIF